MHVESWLQRLAPGVATPRFSAQPTHLFLLSWRKVWISWQHSSHSATMSDDGSDDEYDEVCTLSLSTSSRHTHTECRSSRPWTHHCSFLVAKNQLNSHSWSCISFRHTRYTHRFLVSPLSRPLHGTRCITARNSVLACI